MLLGTLFQCLALDNIYSQPNTRIQASEWIYHNLKPGTILTYEQWDDALPEALPGHDPGMYPQAVYTNPQGQATTGLPLYDDDTTAKAQTIAKMLMQTGAITMPTDRLDKSIPRLPERYPLTIHYYDLLFSGKLGFHLAAQFEVRPSFLGITLDDSGSDESYSVFDHPDARIFVRDNPFPFQSTDQIVALLLQGVHLPPPNPQQLSVVAPYTGTIPGTGSTPSVGRTPSMGTSSYVGTAPRARGGATFTQQSFVGSPIDRLPVFPWLLALPLLFCVVSKTQREPIYCALPDLSGPFA